VAAHSEDFVILACTILRGLNGMTERQTPRRWLRCAKHYVLSCVKIMHNHNLLTYMIPLIYPSIHKHYIYTSLTKHNILHVNYNFCFRIQQNNTKTVALHSEKSTIIAIMLPH